MILGHFLAGLQIIATFLLEQNILDKSITIKTLNDDSTCFRYIIIKTLSDDMACYMTMSCHVFVDVSMIILHVT